MCSSTAPAKKLETCPYSLGNPVKTLRNNNRRANAGISFGPKLKVPGLFEGEPASLDGTVTLSLCERVSGHLSAYRERYALEVSSPGQDRPLTKPQHFSRFLGRRAKLRLRGPRCESASVTGELVGASERDVTIAASEGVVTIPYEQIARSNLIPGD